MKFSDTLPELQITGSHLCENQMNENWNLFVNFFLISGSGKYQKYGTHPTLVWEGPPRGPTDTRAGNPRGEGFQVSTMGEFGVP